MTKDVYVYSTLSAPVAYALHETGENGIPVEQKKIVIAGGANVADKNFNTPYGVATKVSAEDFALLEKHPSYITHKKNGYLKNSSELKDADVVAADLKGRDESSPLVPQDFKENAEFAGDGAAPVVNGKHGNKAQEAEFQAATHGRGELKTTNPAAKPHRK